MTTGVRLDVLNRRRHQQRRPRQPPASQRRSLYRAAPTSRPPRSSHDLRAITRKLSPGERVPAPSSPATGYDLIARPVEELEKKVGLTILGRARARPSELICRTDYTQV